MAEFDVIVVGGGVNGLTTAAYLAKAGARVCVVERRDEVGAHCSTEEVTLPGFRHNLHATWIITASSPVVEDLELEKFGFDPVFTENAYTYPFADGKCSLIHSWDVKKTYDNWARFSKKDAETYVRMGASIAPYMTELIERMLYRVPSVENFDRVQEIMQRSKYIPPDIQDMNGFELLDLLFESEHLKTMMASLQWIGGIPPLHRTVGSLGALMALSLGPVYSVHQLRGGSHMLPHALARCILHHGGLVLQSCEVEKIIIENGRAAGVKLSEHACYPDKELRARKAVVSNLTARPTLQMVGEEHFDPMVVRALRNFRYDEQVIFGAHFALREAPRWKAAGFEDGINRAFMGYLGAESLDDLRRFAVDLVSGRIHEPLMANWFLPTRADPTQAPPGQHTGFLWLDVPPDLRFNGGPDGWDTLRDELVGRLADRWSDYAPNFKASILASYGHTPRDIERRNPSAVKGNWLGGSVVPEQLYLIRPYLGHGAIAPRTPIPGLYLSNSIWPPGTTFLGSGYITALAMAEDIGIQKPPWWNHKPLSYLHKNMGRFSKAALVPR